MLNRDSVIWTIGLIVAVLMYGAGSMPTLVPSHYWQDVFKELAGLLGVLSALLKASPAPKSGSPDQAWKMRSVLHLNEKDPTT